MAGQYILGAAGAISAYVFGNYYIRKRATPLPLEVVGPRMEVAGGLDILPLVSAVLDSLPTSFRQNLSVQVARLFGKSKSPGFYQFCVQQVM